MTKNWPFAKITDILLKSLSQQNLRCPSPLFQSLSYLLMLSGWCIHDRNIYSHTIDTIISLDLSLLFFDILFLPILRCKCLMIYNTSCFFSFFIGIIEAMTFCISSLSSTLHSSLNFLMSFCCPSTLHQCESGSESGSE